MLRGPLYYIVSLYLDACFASVDVGALERAELEQLARWNRGLAKVMLVLGALLLLPLVGVAVASSIAWGMGEVMLLGYPVVGCFVAALAALMLAQVLLVGLLVVLCMFCMEWEPFGFVLALADLLHTSPEVLQNVWRVMVILPAVALLLVCRL